MQEHQRFNAEEEPLRPTAPVQVGLTQIAIGLIWLAIALVWALSPAAHAASLEIHKAAWDASSGSLHVAGTGQGRITVVDAATQEYIGRAKARRDAWEITRRLETAPCRVRAEGPGGDAAERAVDDAPAVCAGVEPVAVDDGYTTTAARELAVAAPGILANDEVGGAEGVEAVLVSDASYGRLSVSPDGAMAYVPDATYTGEDSFAYVLETAGGGRSAPANVTLAVMAADQATSINSTSANGAQPAEPVAEQGPVDDPNYTLLAINDLGMHCGDLDTRISSILPPFNVLHAQVVQRGIAGLPRVLGEQEVDLYYSAASNPDDPVIGKALAGDVLSSTVNGEVYKTNFWDIAFQAYDPFYPDGILELFYDPNDPASNVDIGLPVPDVERLYLGDGELHATQQAMPGLTNPYLANERQPFQEHFNDFPLFIGFPFGYVAEDVNWFEAAGVPIAAFDDVGRENAYPLVRVEAEIAGLPVATLDTVMPISGEAECQACHAAPADGGNGSALEALATVTASIEDPVHGAVPEAVSIEWASDLNILRLHDQKHGTTLNAGFDPETGRAEEPVVCQRCHYTPALDLAQVGPNEVNGRDQLEHKSMSNVMHSHHASTGLFPDMPPAIDAQGNRRDPVTTQTVLEETCYMCHPGKRTQCMRGAMANAGLVCQDCHGQMAQVGDDFSRNVSPSNPGAFELAADFYTNPQTPRVPWANEPGCGSCHTGDAMDNLAGSPGHLVNPADTQGNGDGIRLLQAYREGDPKATPIVPTNKRFAEDVVENGPAAGNPKLYRVSTGGQPLAEGQASGHGGLFCEGCHGSTHAEWPNANPNANDNVAAIQLQGHAGTITECTTCHEPTDASLPLGLGGPHGMHPVVNDEDRRWNIAHEAFAENGVDSCRTCHGADLEGTVLSRAAADRSVVCKNDLGSLSCTDDGRGNLVATLSKGTPVGCGMCHEPDVD